MQPALERQQLALRRVARSFGEDDQRGALGQRLHDDGHRLGIAAARPAVHQHRIEDLAADEAAHARAPIVEGGHRARAFPDPARQHRPDQDEVAMAGVIGEIDALPGIGQAALPVRQHAGERAGKGHD